MKRFWGVLVIVGAVVLGSMAPASAATTERRQERGCRSDYQGRDCHGGYSYDDRGDSYGNDSGGDCRGGGCGNDQRRCRGDQCRGSFSPGPFDRSPVTIIICPPGTVNCGTGGGQGDGKEPPPQKQPS